MLAAVGVMAARPVPFRSAPTAARPVVLTVALALAPVALVVLLTWPACCAATPDPPDTRREDQVMDPAIAFYQSLSGVSFTLLGIWFAVMQFGHGDWRDQAGTARPCTSRCTSSCPGWPGWSRC